MQCMGTDLKNSTVVVDSTSLESRGMSTSDVPGMVDGVSILGIA